MYTLANPKRFLRITERVFPLVFLLTFPLLGLGLYWGLFVSPPDYQQGHAARIMYIHVPAAWMALGIYTFMSLSSFSFLVWKHPLSALFSQAAAPIGACFTLICLCTGSLWGKPMWGTWWVWDARLTSVLILLFLYIGYIVFIQAFENPEKGEKIGAYLNLVGFINIPLIKFSVEWWNTLHQPGSFFKVTGSTVHESMWPPLIFMVGAYGCYFLSVFIVRLRTAMIQRKLWISRQF